MKGERNNFKIMQINNLTEQDVKELEVKLNELIKINPEIKYKVFYDIPENVKNELKNGEYTNLMQRLAEIEARFVGLENVIKLIFGKHVLMNGRFIEIK